MYPSIAPLFQLILEIYYQVGTAKKNVRHCRRLVDEVKTMEPILKDIETRVSNFPTTIKEMVDGALELLLKDFQAALDFIARQNKKGAIKKFVVAKTTDEEFQEISCHIKNSRDIFMFAIVNKIDAAASSPSPSSPPSSPSSKKTSSEMAELRKAFNEKKYEEAIKIGKELLRTVPPQSEMCYVIYLSMACSYACLNDREDAMMYIHCAKENGWDDVQYLECEDLSNLREFPEFITFKEKMSQEQYKKERWRALPQEQVDQLTRNFERYDIDGSGTISATEFRVLMKRNSGEMSDAEIQKLFADMDSEKTGQIELNGYLNYLADNSKKIPSFLRKQPSVEDISAHLQDFSLSPNKSTEQLANSISFSLSKQTSSPPSPTLPTPPPPSLPHAISPTSSYSSYTSYQPAPPSLPHPPPPSLSHESSFHLSPPQLSDFSFSSPPLSHTSLPHPSYPDQYPPHAYHSLPPAYAHDPSAAPYHSLPAYAPPQTHDFIHAHHNAFTHDPHAAAHHSLPAYTAHENDFLHAQDNIHAQDDLHAKDPHAAYQSQPAHDPHAAYHSLPAYGSPQLHANPHAQDFLHAQAPPAYYSTDSYYAPPAVNSQYYTQNAYYQ